MIKDCIVKMTLLSNTNSPKEEQWIYISDLMAGLMIIFLFVSVLLMFDLRQKVNNYEQVKIDICQKLNERFPESKFLEENGEGWKVIPCTDGVNIKFETPLNEKGFFESGSSKLNPDFRKLLSSFNRDLLKFLIDHKTSIHELRIEGHADSQGFDNAYGIIEYCLDRMELPDKLFNGIENKAQYNTQLVKKYIKNAKLSDNELKCLRGMNATSDKRIPKEQNDQLNYIKNTRLSLDRSRSVLRHLMRTELLDMDYDSWKDITITTHGFSSSKLAGSDTESRRVEFRIILNEEKVVEKTAKKFGRYKQ